MSNPPIRLTRDQLAAFAPNQRVLRALEQLLLNQSDDSDDIVGDFLTAYIEAANASAAANSAMALIESKFAELSGMIPPQVLVVQEVDPLPKRVENIKPKLDYFDLDLTPVGIQQEGRTMWDADNGVPATGLAGGVVRLQHGLELLKRVKNASGGALTDGQIVYLNDATGALPKAYLASADSTTPEKWCVCGMVTEPIGDNQPGFITVIGAVSDVDTSAYVEGTKLYLSATTPGAFTDTMPEAPDAGIPIGIVLRQHATEGQILFFPDKAKRLVDLADVNGTPLDADGLIPVWDNTEKYFDFTANINDKAPAYNGLLDGSLFTVSYTPATRVYEVVVSSDTHAWANGTRVFIAADTYTMDAHADTTGVYYLLIGEDGTIHVDSTFTFLDHAIVSYAYYNATTNKGLAFDERHPADRVGWPASIHSYQHFTVGSVLRSGGTVSGYTLASNAKADMQFDVDETIFFDESYQNTCAPLTGGDGVYSLWYRSGADADGEWDWTTGADLPMVLSTNNPTYNLLSGGNWSNAAITNNSRWVNVWLVAVNSLDSDQRFINILGQALHTTLAAAEAESFLTGISWGVLPFAEIVPLAKITFRRATGVGYNFYIEEVTSIRGTKASVTSTVSPTAHNTLSGRSDPGCHPATAITYSDTTVDAALTARELLANKETVLTDSDTYYPSSSAVLDGIALQVNPRQFGQAIALTAKTSGTRGITVGHNDNIDMGTNNFCVFASMSAINYTKAVKHYIVSKTNSTDTAGFIFNLEETTGKFRVRASFSGSMVSFVSTATPAFLDGCWYELSAVITRETASVDGSIAFYINGRHFETVAIPAASPSSISTNQPMFICGLKDRRLAATHSRVMMLNFTPTAAQMLDIYRNGIPEAWKWGNQTAVYSSNFSAGVDSFTGSGANVSLTGNTDSIASEDDWLKVERINTTGTAGIYRPSTVTANKTYRHSARVYNPASSGFAYFGFFDENATYLGGVTATAEDAITTISGIVNQTNSAYLGIYPCSAAGVALTTVVAGKIWYVKDISATQIGAVIALEPEGIQPNPGQWLDASTNKLHAMQPAAGSSLTRPQRSFEVRWTNTWAGTHEAQYIGGVNQNVLPSNAYIESIVGIVSGTTVEDIIIGDGSDTDRWVAATTGLAVGTTSFTIANRVSDGTNRKLVVDPDADATMSIVWTIKGYILEA